MSALLRHGDLFHVGVVVDDFEQARAEVAAVSGVTWGLEAELDVSVLLDDGLRTVTFRFAYSQEGPVRIELLQSVPGTPWEVAGSGQAHHLGYWVSDVAKVSKRLSTPGVPRVAQVNTEGGPDRPMTATHKGPFGPYIEVVDVALRQTLFGEDAEARP